MRSPNVPANSIEAAPFLSRPRQRTPSVRPAAPASAKRRKKVPQYFLRNHEACQRSRSLRRLLLNEERPRLQESPIVDCLSQRFRSAMALEVSERTERTEQPELSP